MVGTVPYDGTSCNSRAHWMRGPGKAVHVASPAPRCPNASTCTGTSLLNGERRLSRSIQEREEREETGTTAPRLWSRSGRRSPDISIRSAEEPVTWVQSRQPASPRADSNPRSGIGINRPTVRRTSMEGGSRGKEEKPGSGSMTRTRDPELIPVSSPAWAARGLEARAPRLAPPGIAGISPARAAVGLSRRSPGAGGRVHPGCGRSSPPPPPPADPPAWRSPAPGARPGSR